MYRSHTDAEDYNLWKQLQIIEGYTLCTNAGDYNLQKPEYQCHFKHGSNPDHFLTSHVISRTNNMIINVSKMCRISLCVSGVNYNILSGVLTYLITLEAKLKENYLIFRSKEIGSARFVITPMH